MIPSPVWEMLRRQRKVNGKLKRKKSHRRANKTTASAHRQLAKASDVLHDALRG